MKFERTQMKDFTRLPVINIAGLYSDDINARRKVAEELGKAASEVGFFYIVGHQIPKATIAGLRQAAKDLFALPYEAKMQHYIGRSQSHKGYVPEGEEIYNKKGKPDHKEAFDIGYETPLNHPLVLAGTPLIGENEWPEIANFRARVEDYYQRVFAVGKRLFQGFALALDLPEHYFDELAKNPPSKLRLIHYPFDKEAIDAPGIGAHTDYECFTLLLADEAGLEVMNDHGEWIDAPPLSIDGEEAYVINIGDMLEVMTAGIFTATSHRVRKVQHERYSFPLFYACDYATRIKPLPKFASLGHNESYEELAIGDHMWSQALQTYRYLMEKVAAGELQLPDHSRKPASFGYLKDNTQQP